MDTKEMFVVDLSVKDEQRSQEGRRSELLCYQIRQLPPRDPEIRRLTEELFCGHIGSTSKIHPPFFVNFGNKVSIGEGCTIMNGFQAMAAGGITIEDNVLISLGCTIATNNHDLKNRSLLTCRPVVIRKNAWLGVNVTLLPGVEIGENCVIGAGSVVTHSIEANAMAAGNPARVLRHLREDEIPD